MSENSPKKERRVRLVPVLTPALLEKNADFQKTLRQGRAAFNPQFAQLAHYRLVIEENKQLLKYLTDQLKQTVSISPRYDDLQKIIALKAEETAAAFFEIGEFEMAAKFTVSKDTKKLFKAYQVALDLDDNAHCTHPKYTLIENSMYPNYYRERDIYSPKHQRFVSIIKCNECDFRNIRENPNDLAALSQARADFRREYAQTSTPGNRPRS